MPRLLIAFFILIANLEAFAATKIKVSKIKGDKALVEFEGPLKEGQSYIIPDPSTPETNTRGFRLGVSSDINSLATKTPSSTNNSTLLALNLDFGWNWGDSEAGWILEFRSTKDDDSGTSSLVGLGVFYDRNFTANLDPVESLFGWGARLIFSGVSEGGSENLTHTSLYLNLFWKYFVTPHGALRADLGYFYDAGKASATTNATISGPKASLGLALYY